MAGIRRPPTKRPALDWSAGYEEWLLSLPPHGVNHVTQLARKAVVPHIYKVSESRRYEEYVKLSIHGWYPPPKTPLVVVLDFALLQDTFLGLDVDKWGAVVVDAVLGARCDHWMVDFRSRKGAVVEPGCMESVLVRVEWTPPEPKRRAVRGATARSV